MRQITRNSLSGRGYHMRSRRLFTAAASSTSALPFLFGCAILHDYKHKRARDILPAWLACSRDPACISPPGSKADHQYDQAALSVHTSGLGVMAHTKVLASRARATCPLSAGVCGPAGRRRGALWE